ncbi:MAG TPA: heavy metal translocating P-type ATPase, partial [Planctomycetaceae bacterium]|nr:heavy metal translocating P-type ATPase [Planctomycetaceae bacterium]
GCHFSGLPSAAAAAATAACASGGIIPLKNSLASLREGSLNVDLLMLLAAAGAALIGDWLEGAVLLFLFSLSGTLEAFATYRTARSIESLIALRPATAALLQDGSEVQVAVDSLLPGCQLRVRPGERFPVDGQITDGTTWADESTLTGESEQIAKHPGDNIFAGTLNGQGSVVVRMTRAVQDTTLERIVHLVQEAQSRKTPSQRFVESWQQPYVIGVLSASLLVFLGSWLLQGTAWQHAFYHAMVLLVAGSPCAVVVGAPAVLLSAIARAGRQGILFKGGVHLEQLGHVDVMAFDKTGTVTLGKPAVVEFWTPPAAAANELLRLAAAVEDHSEHPLKVPVLAELTRRQLTPITEPLVEFHSHTGLGVHAHVGGVWVGVGREGLFETHDLQLPPDLLTNAGRMREQGQTALLVCTSTPGLYGVLGVADQLRPEAPGALQALQKLGIHRRVILTGDHERVARAVAARLGADDVRAGLLPDQKVVQIGQLAATGNTVAMIGDGVNDAPALAAAHLGIAMGGAGTDVALEVADVVLMRDDLKALPLAVWISRQARRRVRQNMIFAFAMIAALVIATFFQLPLWLGVIGHEGSTVLVVLNGLRILWEPLPNFNDGNAASP